jgi:hypothetical protein
MLQLWRSSVSVRPDTCLLGMLTCAAIGHSSLLTFTQKKQKRHFLSPTIVAGYTRRLLLVRAIHCRILHRQTLHCHIMPPRPLHRRFLPA